MIEICVPLITTIIVAELSVIEVCVVTSVITLMIETIIIEVGISPQSVVIIPAVPLCWTKKK